MSFQPVGRELVRVWGLHCDVDLDLVEAEVAAMGWDELGDLNDLEPDRDSFKAAAMFAYPDAKRGTISQWAGQLYRFVHDAQEGEVVVYRHRDVWASIVHECPAGHRSIQSL